jgi:hypothetical protein
MRGKRRKSSPGRFNDGLACQAAKLSREHVILASTSPFHNQEHILAFNKPHISRANHVDEECFTVA